MASLSRSIFKKIVKNRGLIMKLKSILALFLAITLSLPVNISDFVSGIGFLANSVGQVAIDNLKVYSSAYAYARTSERIRHRHRLAKKK